MIKKLSVFSTLIISFNFDNMGKVPNFKLTFFPSNRKLEILM
jgi:hypothetical protein